MIETVYNVQTANVNISSLNSKIQTNHKQQATEQKTTTTFIMSVHKTVLVIKHISTDSEYDINMI